MQHVLEPGGTEVSTPAGGARRYRKPLRLIRWRDVKPIFEAAFEGWVKHNAPRLGASLAFYTLLSLAPFSLVLVSVIGMALGDAAAESGIVNQVRMLGGADAAKAVEVLLAGSQNTTHGVLATIFGIVVLLFGASGVLVELRDDLNTIWEVKAVVVSGTKRIYRIVRDRLFSFAVVLSIAFILIVSMAVSAWIAALGQWTQHVLPAPEFLLHLGNFVVSFAITTFLFAAIYKIMPDLPIEWGDVVLGGAVTSVLFNAGKVALGIYLGKSSYASTYGAAASIVLTIVWVYYSAQIFFFGAEFTKAFADCYGSKPGDHPEGAVVDQTGTPTEHEHEKAVIVR